MPINCIGGGMIPLDGNVIASKMFEGYSGYSNDPTVKIIGTAKPTLRVSSTGNQHDVWHSWIDAGAVYPAVVVTGFLASVMFNGSQYFQEICIDGSVDNNSWTRLATRKDYRPDTTTAADGNYHMSSALSVVINSNKYRYFRCSPSDNLSNYLTTAISVAALNAY